MEIKIFEHFLFFMSMIWGLLPISLNFPNSLNTFKEVWLLSGMASMLE